MKCPKDQSELVVTERHGIEIDHCPTCRGVWLDRGELDKVREQSAQKDQDESMDSGGFLEDLLGGFGGE